MPNIKLRKVGGSVSAAIPPSVLEALSLTVGTEMRVEIDNGRVVLAPTSPRGRIGIRRAPCSMRLFQASWQSRTGRDRRVARQQAYRARSHLMKVRRGDIFNVDLEPTMGREQRYKRPVLVVSPDDYNDKFAPLVCPITTGGAYARDRGFAVPISGGKTGGVVLCNQARTLDLDAQRRKGLRRSTLTCCRPSCTSYRISSPIESAPRTLRELDTRCRAAPSQMAPTPYQGLTGQRASSGNFTLSH